MNSTIIVAHRGLPALYPENTLEGIQQAVAAGARAVEFDVQLTGDGVPVLFHDVSLERMCAVSGRILETSYAELKGLSAFFPGRFGDTYAGTPVPTLKEAMELLLPYDRVTPCIELKTESIECFGVKKCVNAIISAAAQVLERSIILSFADEALSFLHELGIRRTGWVLSHYDEQSLERAHELEPEVLVCAIDKLNGEESLWPGPWDWMLYHSEDPAVILDCVERGARYVETDNARVVAERLPGLFNDG